MYIHMTVCDHVCVVVVVYGVVTGECRVQLLCDWSVSDSVMSMLVLLA